MKKIILSNKALGVNFALLIFRVSLGISMFWGHGLGKWNKLFSGGEIKFFDPIGLGSTAALGLAVFAEVICSILLILGLLTRLALIPLIVTMSVALFLVHISDSFGTQEKSILYLTGYVVLFITGSGRYSLDGLLKR
ncbi:DoxX family protein [Wenyingzhuangia sp. 2_MG-2023]|uniref:DoxX family protein n=1 Tax=Wenyingzhuangia sp. 2_MG-2023 TaxID=3062639 RepID=UPI0026E254AD|nr:DoxX family protein [Wenyingzhuangia sp. 2_MG-2023]MDO6738917.1 DoxX family protein [Wenyingzhuangia sp. 2_MG-2023]MDO6802934.1 DoxX family protein [Wenyingzhuangia sp. 1_MG-2023]